MSFCFVSTCTGSHLVADRWTLNAHATCEIADVGAMKSSSLCTIDDDGDDYETTTRVSASASEFVTCRRRRSAQSRAKHCLAAVTPPCHLRIPRQRRRTTLDGLHHPRTPAHRTPSHPSTRPARTRPRNACNACFAPLPSGTRRWERIRHSALRARTLPGGDGRVWM